MSDRGSLTEPLFRRLRDALVERRDALGSRLAAFEARDGGVSREQERRIREHLANVRRSRLGELLRDGILSEPAYQQILRDVDEASKTDAAGDAEERG